MTISREPDPMTLVREFVDRFNQGDLAFALAVSVDDTRIIDDFPPHEWIGRAAMTAWYSDMIRLTTKHRMSDWSVTLREPRQLLVAEEHAYLVVPIDLQWLQAGTREARTGFITTVLRETAAGWRISTWAWTWE